MLSKVTVPGKPLYLLKAMLQEKYGKVYEAAKLLGVRESEFSICLSGRAQMSEELILRIEEALQRKRSEFLKSTLE